MKTFTEEQQRALDLHVHCAVHANAGSGKTSVLTERFLRILRDSGTPMDAIVAITFTRAAAAEMRERVHAALVAMDASGSDPRVTRWLDELGQARIQTFHAFCASLIRMATDELGLDADVRDMEESEAAVLMSDAVNAALRDALRAQDQRAGAALSVFEDLSIDTASIVVSNMLRSRRLRMRAPFQRPHAEVLEEHIVTLESLRTLLAYDAVDTAIAVLQAYPSCESFDATIRELMDARASDSGARMTEVLSSIFTAKGEFRKNRILKSEKDTLQFRPTLPDHVVKTIDGVLTETIDPIVELRLLTIVDTLTRIGIDAHERYTAAKRERNALDFDDMIGLVVTLLDNEEVASAVRSGIRYIMVDEFQDTDPDQYEVLRKLIPALTGAAATTPNVFIVGDDKQSIYGFRSADVRLFRRATRDIRAANLRSGTDDGFRPLSRSFRMHQDLCTIVNRMCRSMFPEVDPAHVNNETSFEVAYSDLVAGLEAPVSDRLGTCRRLPVVDDEWDTIARAVADLLHGNHSLDVATYDRTTAEWTNRAPLPSDIAILVRKNEHVRAMASALRFYGVPFHVHGGRAFFSRPEVADIRALLRACADASDDLATATVMRSPILRCTDAEIASCALAGRPTSLRDGLDVLVRDGRATDGLRAAHRHFTTWSEAILTMPLPTFIRTVLDDTQWHAAIAADDRRDQILANVEKVLDIVRSTIDGTGAGIADVIDALLPPLSDNEREGAVEVDGDAVQIMTMHMAKGLEFNIVILGGLDSGRNSGSVIRTDELGITFSLAPKAVSHDDLLKLTSPPPAITHEVNKVLEDRRARAEELRMLYVALTRAKMHVILAMPSEDVKEPSKYGSMARTLHGALASLPERDQRMLVPSEQPARYVAASRTPIELDLSAPIPVPPPDLISPSALLRLRTEHDATVALDAASASGMAYGTAVHEALAAIIRNVGSMSAEELSTTIVRVLARHDIDRTAAAEAVHEILAVLNLDILRAAHPLLPHARVETRLASALGDVVLHGVLDLRMTRSDGSMEIWDWKTNTVASSDDVEALANDYAVQMCSYAWLCLSAFPDLPAVHTRLVFTKAARRGLAVCSHERTWRREELPMMEAQLLAMAVPAA